MSVYHWRTDQNGNVVGDTPLDAHNHSVKALIYYLVAESGVVSAQKRDTIAVRHRNRERKAVMLHDR